MLLGESHWYALVSQFWCSITVSFSWEFPALHYDIHFLFLLQVSLKPFFFFFVGVGLACFTKFNSRMNRKIFHHLGFSMWWIHLDKHHELLHSEHLISSWRFYYLCSSSSFIFELDFDG